jgi:hypothetical protein
LAQDAVIGLGSLGLCNPTGLIDASASLLGRWGRIVHQIGLSSHNSSSLANLVSSHVPCRAVQESRGSRFPESRAERGGVRASAVACFASDARALGIGWIPQSHRHGRAAFSFVPLPIRRGRRPQIQRHHGCIIIALKVCARCEPLLYGLPSSSIIRMGISGWGTPVSTPRPREEREAARERNCGNQN